MGTKLCPDRLRTGNSEHLCVLALQVCQQTGASRLRNTSTSVAQYVNMIARGQFCLEVSFLPRAALIFSLLLRTSFIGNTSAF